MNQEKIGKFIAKLRKDKNMTQEDLAQILGVNSRSVSRWETGKCMPDLSLLSPISEELEVSINELMSGEKIASKEYQNTFEKNMVTTISKVDKSNKAWKILYRLSMGLLILVWGTIGISIFLNNYQLTMKYNSKTMNITKNENLTLEFVEQQLNIEVKNVMGLDTQYLITSYIEDETEYGIIFIKAKESIVNYFQRKNIYKDCKDLTYCSSTFKSIDIHNPEFPKNYKVYYTTLNFKKIANANDSEIKKIIAKSNLMYEEKAN